MARRGPQQRSLPTRQPLPCGASRRCLSVPEILCVRSQKSWTVQRVPRQPLDANQGSAARSQCQRRPDLPVIAAGRSCCEAIESRRDWQRNRMHAVPCLRAPSTGLATVGPCERRPNGGTAVLRDQSVVLTLMDRQPFRMALDQAVRESRPASSLTSMTTTSTQSHGSSGSVGIRVRARSGERHTARCGHWGSRAPA